MTPGVLSPQASSGRSLSLLVSEAEQSQASSRSRSCDELTPARASHKTSPGISPPRLAPHLSHPLRGQLFSTFLKNFCLSYSAKKNREKNFVTVAVCLCTLVVNRNLLVTIQQSIQSDSKLSWIISADILLNQLIER